MGADQKDDILIYENKANPEWIFSADLSNDGKYLLIGSMKGTDRKNLLHYLDISEKIAVNTTSNATAHATTNATAHATTNSTQNKTIEATPVNSSLPEEPKTKNYIKFTPLPKMTPLIPDWIGEFSAIHNIGTKFYF